MRIRIKEEVGDQVDKIHKYLMAINEIILEMRDNHMLSIYDAGFISPEKQYLTCGVNGLVCGAEFLGIEISNNDAYRDYVNSIMSVIYETNRSAKTKTIMFNTEMVPRQALSGHVKSSLIDLELPRGQQGASVMAA